ncbi:MAG: aspartate--tRNA ligase [Parcubacteria group bacterium]|nr:aspartate--tRNA ligase [Parcubacteria group bacterium]
MPARILTKYIKNKIGQSVILAGWVNVRRDHGKIIFIDLRDRFGLCQLVFIPKNKELYQEADKLRSEWVIEVEGVVNQRPKGMENPKIETGELEVLVEKLKILNAAKTPPFEINEEKAISEEIRLKYRYLDLRRERLKNNLVLRHEIIKFFRDWLSDRNFLEIETPLLTKSTPEGARDFVVPSRLHQGKFYALPQSPQQYKQLLMAAGLEKYFQIARALRDEDPRADRQSEHTQLDLEMSFIEAQDVMNLIEDMILGALKHILPQFSVHQQKWPKIGYQEAMKNYGSDKPDLRIDKTDSKELAFAWIIDFPLFEWNKEEKRWDSTHNPFTSPRPEFIEFLEKINASGKLTDDAGLEKIISRQYDLVLNGHELGSGSIRINQSRLLEKIFQILGHSQENIRENFGHMLEAFEYGTPPHGGIALGIDRLIMILAGEPNIREVIAFPKTGDSRDPMMGSPSEIDKKQLDEIGLEIKKKK